MCGQIKKHAIRAELDESANADAKRIQRIQYQSKCHLKTISVAQIGRIIKELKEKAMLHFWNYPRSPKSNAFTKCFNRTLREQFLEQY